MIEPVSREQWDAGTVELPPQLFSHNLQSRATQNVHAQSNEGRGILSRVKDALHYQGELATMYSISGNKVAIEGSLTGAAADIVDRLGGATPFDEYGRIEHLHESLERIVRNGSTSIMADTWSRQMLNAMARSRKLAASIDVHGTLNQTFEATSGDYNSGLAQQLEQAARIVSARKYLRSSRDMFFVDIGGFDSHSDAFATLELRFPMINAALDSFVQEMKLQGVWENVTIVQTSEFARTITSNGAGTDHAWGGHMFMVGGSLNGGRIHGTCPSLALDSDLNVGGGRGRYIPTTPWEGLWDGLAKWFGVKEEHMDGVLPNRKNFPAEQLIPLDQLFKTSSEA